MKQLFAVILFITTVFSSCDFEKTVEISHIPITPHLVLNGLLYADSDTSYFYITSSRPIYTDTTTMLSTYLNWDYKMIEDAVLNLTVNGKSDYIEYNRTDSIYLFLSKLKEGDKVSIESSYAGQQIKSTVVLPSAPEVLSVDTSSFNRIEYGQLRNFILFKLKIRDNPGTNNYYRLLVNNRFIAFWDDEVRAYNSSYYSNDPVLTEGYTGSIESNGQINTGLASSLYNSFSIFRDVRFAGKEYTLTFYVENSLPYWYTPDDSEYTKRRHLTVSLQSITEDLYKYYSSLQRSRQTADDKVSEPVIVHTNIDGGLGILGACNQIKVFEYKNVQ